MHETELLRRVKALEKDENCVIEREREDLPPTARFWRIDRCADEVDQMIIQNFPETAPGPMSPRLHMDLPLRPLSASWPRPIFHWDHEGRAKPVHLYRKGEVFLVSEPLLSCVLMLDPGGIEHCRAIVENLVSPWTWHLILPVRAIDPVDLPRTRVELSRRPVLPGSDTYIRYAWLNTFEGDGYSVRNDIPAEIHIFSNTYDGDVLVSIELIEAMRSGGIAGACFARTEGYKRLRENRTIAL